MVRLEANLFQYPIFEAALTGRTEGSWDQSVDATLNIPQTQSEAEREHIRNSVATREGLILDIFDVLRRVPRIMLMVCPTSASLGSMYTERILRFSRSMICYGELDVSMDSNGADVHLRGLDHDLMTTHSNVCIHTTNVFTADIPPQIRVFLVTAKYCMRAVWRDERERISRGTNLLSFLYQYATGWLSFKKDYYSLTLVEMAMDTKASTVKFWAWLLGLRHGYRAAHAAASGLSV